MHNDNTDTIMANIEIEQEILGGHLIIHLTGRIAGEASIESYRQIKTLAEKHSSLNIVLDFKKLTFIDSSGLGFLVAVNSTLLKQQRSLTLSSVPDNLMSLLKMTNLDKVLKIVPSTDYVV